MRGIGLLSGAENDAFVYIVLRFYGVPGRNVALTLHDLRGGGFLGSRTNHKLSTLLPLLPQRQFPMFQTSAGIFHFRPSP